MRTESTTAWSHEVTRGAFRRYRLIALVWLGVGALGTVGIPPAAVAFDRAGMERISSLMAGLWVGFISALIIGVCLARNAARMRRCLRRRPWTAYPVTVLPPGLGGPVVRLCPADTGEVFVQSVVAFTFRWHHLGSADTLWFCGVPGRGGVLARPGGEPLLWGRRIRVPWIRHWREHVDRG